MISAIDQRSWKWMFGWFFRCPWLAICFALFLLAICAILSSWFIAAALLLSNHHWTSLVVEMHLRIFLLNWPWLAFWRQQGAPSPWSAEWDISLLHRLHIVQCTTQVQSGSVGFDGQVRYEEEMCVAWVRDWAASDGRLVLQQYWEMASIYSCAHLFEIPGSWMQNYQFVSLKL